MISAVTKSDSIANLASAMTKVQAVVENAKKDSANPYFNSKYADLESVWGVARKPLTDHGLSIVQFPEGGEGQLGVTTLLLHVSGEWIACSIFIKMEKETNPQVAGSIITYFRRYSLQAVLGIATEDDDGEAGRKLAEARTKTGTTQPAKTTQTTGTTTDSWDKPKDTVRDTSAMVRMIHVLMKKKGAVDDNEKHEIAEVLLNKDKGTVVSFKDLTWDECKKVIDELQKG